MLVFGDPCRVRPARELLDAVRADLDALGVTPQDARLDATVRILVDVGSLAQALIDARFEQRGRDGRGVIEWVCHDAVWHAARLVLGQDGGESLRTALQALAGAELPREVAVKLPEGFAFYAVHPLLYAGAARDWRKTEDRPFVAVGLRSIGTSLAAMVAAAGGSAHPPVTLRPVGPAFRREVRMSEALAQWLTSMPADTLFAIVDDGPGLSGSSFGAVADWFEKNGVGLDRLVFFPSHAHDPGSEASEAHRRRWKRAKRFVRPFESLLDEHAPWSARQPERVEDLSAGAWRERFWTDKASWPPSNVRMERRKYLGTGSTGPWLAKFVGLGRIGERIAARAHVLAGAGFVPPVFELKGGFLFSEWIQDARPLWPEPVGEREALIDHVARYIAFRARSMPLEPGERGATPGELLEMARRNAGLALGDDARVLERWTGRLGEIESGVRPVCSDNRMQPWEWLRLPDGRLLKTDAVDHHASHEMVGPQDPWWDAAGAVVEFGLDAREEESFLRRLIAEGVLTDSVDLRDFFVQAYLAFQLGAWTLAAGSLDGDEAQRCRDAARRYEERLRRELAPPAMPAP